MKKTIFALGAFLVFPAIAFGSFSDVPTSHQFYDAINYVQSNGIVQGYPDKTFKPDQMINRAEFATIITKSLSATGIFENCTPTIKFPDVDISDWFYPYICITVNEGIAHGYPDKTFKPYNNINFAEISKMLVEAYNISNSSTGGAWYQQYTAAIEKLNAKPTSIKQFDQQITRGEMAQMIYLLINQLKQTNTSAKKITRDEIVNYYSGSPYFMEFHDPGNTYEGTYHSRNLIGYNKAGVFVTIISDNNNDISKVLISLHTSSPTELLKYLKDFASVTESDLLKNNAQLINEMIAEINPPSNTGTFRKLNGRTATLSYVNNPRFTIYKDEPSLVNESNINTKNITRANIVNYYSESPFFMKFFDPGNYYEGTYHTRNLIGNIYKNAENNHDITIEIISDDDNNLRRASIEIYAAEPDEYLKYFKDFASVTDADLLNNNAQILKEITSELALPQTTHATRELNGRTVELFYRLDGDGKPYAEKLLIEKR